MADPTYEAWQVASRRCLLTGEPLRPDTIKRRMRVLNPPPGDHHAPTVYGVFRRPANHRRIEELEPLAYIADAAEGDADAE